jgi:prenyltransferase beta subunit
LKVCGYEYPEKFKTILNDLKYYQRDDGSFKCQKWDTEYDSRFIYCACVIPKLLSSDSFDIDKLKLVDNLCRQANYEGGYGLVEGSESNGKVLVLIKSWVNILYCCFFIPNK